MVPASERGIHIGAHLGKSSSFCTWAAGQRCASSHGCGGVISFSFPNKPSRGELPRELLCPVDIAFQWFSLKITNILWNRVWGLKKVYGRFYMKMLYFFGSHSFLWSVGAVGNAERKKSKGKSHFSYLERSFYSIQIDCLFSFIWETQGFGVRKQYLNCNDSHVNA